jgi:prepilin-type N-terminal cleavage/methylation domain-containing protein/prepilin-type processing-associated H-X9-DG protein
MRRPAFTLVELLVVLAIIAVLLALLAPAVQKIRAAAARTECSNNMRQLALAVHQHQHQHRFLPHGQFLGPYGAGPNSKAWSWLARILPFVEQGNLHSQGNIPNTTLADSGVAHLPIVVFQCPSDGSAGRGPRTDAGNLDGFPVGLTSYKAVSGANWGDDLFGVGPVFDTDWRNKGTNGSFDGHADGDGMFYRMDYKRKLRLTDILDGTSNTFMIGEDIPEVHQWCSWPYSNNAYGTCAIPPNLNNDGMLYEGWNWQNTWSFRSRHPGGVHFALADGSVRFISDSISLFHYRALATIRGKEIAAAD